MKMEPGEIEAQLARKADELDALDVPVPPADRFREMVERETHKARRNQRRQLTVFALVAAALLGALLFIWERFDLAFFLLQGAMVAAGAATVTVSLLLPPQKEVRQ